jgi:ubiquinone/menaquinone biosynthesis C-methylase UbiE
MSADPYIEPEADRAKARGLAEAFDDHDLAGFVAHYYRNTAVVPPKHAAQYTRGLLAAPQRSAEQLAAWTRASGVTGVDGFLDLGCGTGPMLVAARDLAGRPIGVDIAFRWLVVARKRLSEAGLDTPLVCASADALPFREEVFDLVTAESVLEHTRNQAGLLSEVRRVTDARGRFWFTTPNRRSVGPDPHTGLLAGGWLPDRAVQAYVKRLGGIPPHRRLLSLGQLRQELRDAGFEVEALDLPQMSHVQTDGPRLLRMAGRAYAWARAVPGVRAALYQLGPGWSGRARPAAPSRSAHQPVPGA